MRGQGLVCLLLGTFYAVGLTLIGLNFGFLIGLGAGLLSFIPYVGSPSGFVSSIGVAFVAVLAGLDLDRGRGRGLPRRPVLEGYVLAATSHRRAASAFIRSG